MSFVFLFSCFVQLFTVREAQLAYTWGRMATSKRPGSSSHIASKMKRRGEGGLPFTGFMEAICRTADTSLVPTDAWIQALAVTDGLRFKVVSQHNKGACKHVVHSS
jgi:hypothetical protein